MKYARSVVLLGVLVSILVVGLAAAQAQWQLVEPQPKVGEKLRMASFLNESFGLTGGAGDVGKARYTTDGGQNWTQVDSSGG
jgi:photosystem II stability/assembly factor-like uncharacterized protein